MIKRIMLFFVCSGMLLGGIGAQSESIQQNNMSSDKDVVVKCNLDPIEAAKRYQVILNESWDRMVADAQESCMAQLALMSKVGEIIGMMALEQDITRKQEVLRQAIALIKTYLVNTSAKLLLPPERSVDCAVYGVIMSRVDKDIQIKLLISLMDLIVDLFPTFYKIINDFNEQYEDESEPPSQEVIVEFTINILRIVADQVKVVCAKTLQENIIEPALAAQKMQTLTTVTATNI